MLREGVAGRKKAHLLKRRRETRTLPVGAAVLARENPEEAGVEPPSENEVEEDGREDGAADAVGLDPNRPPRVGAEEAGVAVAPALVIL
jgi:hypothetical protein